MIVPYLRSSSYGAYSFCQHKYFLSYVLGLEESGNKKAEKGNMLHKVGECLALGKYQHQATGSVGGYDIGDPYIGEYIPDDIYNNKIITPLCKLAYDYYASISENEWDNKDLIEVIQWANKVVEFQNGAFDPRNKKVAHIEKYFDFEIKKDWAQYEFNLDGKKLVGNLALKGTIDLIMEVGDNHYEVLDYKTGQRKDWATGKEKDYESLQKDPQLLLYYYACRNTFPEIKYFDFTIYYINFGGPFTMCFEDEHYELAEELIKKRFYEIRDNTSPLLLDNGDTKRDFKCTKLCHFYKNTYKDTGKRICNFFRDEIKENGIDYVTDKYANKSKISTYGDGGGRKKE